MGRRILLTGLDTFWGGRVAAALERDPEVEVIVGMGTGTPSVELERTEFVRAGNSYSLFSRVVRATRVDTVVHTFLVLDSSAMSGRALHETNVIGTMNLLAAAGAPGSSVRQIVVKSSSLVYGSHPSDPAWFSEESPRTRSARNRVERSLCEVEGYVSDFAEDNPGVRVTVLRFANVLGADIDTPISRNLARGLMPCVAGFDPLLQFLEEDDVVRCVEFAVRAAPPGVFNVAGDGKLPVTEVASIAGARRLLLPPSSPPGPPPRSSASGSSRCRPSCRTSSATAGASTRRGSPRPASGRSSPRRGRCSASPRPTACAGASATSCPGTATSPTSRPSSGGHRRSCATPSRRQRASGIRSPG